MTVLAQDDFSTAYANLAGNPADVGGNWALYYRTAAGILASADGGLGDGGSYFGSTVSGDIYYQIGSLSVGDADHYFTDWGATGGDQLNVGIWARGVSAGTFYEVESASATVTLYRRTSGARTSLGSYSSGGTDVRVHLQTSGVSPTTLKVRSWNRTGSEGTTWSINTTDNTAGNQTAAGALGIWARRSSAAGAYGDDYLVTTLDTYQPRPPGVSFGSIGLV